MPSLLAGMDLAPDLCSAAARLRAVLDAPDLSDEMLVSFYARHRPDLEADELAAHIRCVADELSKPFDP